MGKKAERREQRIAAAKARDAALGMHGDQATLSNFERIIKALTIVAPIFHALKYDDGLSHCFEMSVGAKEVLARRGIAAQVLPCVAVAVHRERQELPPLRLGFTPRQLYDQMEWGDEPAPPFESWAAKYCGETPTDSPSHGHVIIEARFSGERVLIDLTVGQFRVFPLEEAKSIPWQALMRGDGWPSFKTRDWVISYMDSTFSPEGIAEYENTIKLALPPLFFEDLDDLIGLALECNLDENYFHAEMKKRRSLEFDVASIRIAEYGGL